MKEYFIFYILPALLSSCLSFGGAYLILRLTQKGDKKLQLREEARQRCDNICEMICDFNMEAAAAYKLAREAHFAATVQIGTGWTQDERKNFVNQKNLLKEEQFSKMEMLKDKIMIKIRGIEEFDWLASELYHLFRVDLYMLEDGSKYGNKLILLSEKAQKVAEQYLKTL